MTLINKPVRMALVDDRMQNERRSTLFDGVARDVRYAVRALRRAPGFTALSTLILALGIGATTAIFSVVNGILIKPLAYPDAGALISLKHAAPGVTALTENLGVSAALLRTYRSENRTLQEVGLWGKGRQTVMNHTGPEQVENVYVSDGTLRALGVQPAVGRWFQPADYAPESPETVILTHGSWEQRYGGTPSVVGQAITIDSRPRIVIGVMPRDFRFPSAEPSFIVPIRFKDAELHLGGFGFQGLARLKPGVAIEQASADASRMISIWLDTWQPPPGQNRQFFANMRLTPAFRSLKQEVVGDISNVLWVLLATVGGVLLIACANVANLLLVRAEGRQHEVAIRAALGASWRRIAREMLIESLALALLGGVLGVAAAFIAIRLFVSVGPVTLPRLRDTTIDLQVLTFALAISLLSGLVFGLIAVAKHAGARIIGALRGSGPTSSETKERHRARNTLVVVQVALAVVLLVGSGLMIRTFLALRAVRLGVTDPHHVQLVNIAIPSAAVQDPERVVRMQADMRDRLAALPGVSAVSFANAAPMGSSVGDVIEDEDRIFTQTPVRPVRRFKFVAPGYFQTLGTPLIAGRDFTWTDLYKHHPVAVISENLAREMWHEPSAALGKHIRESSSPWREIVGVVGDVHDDGAHLPPPTIVYWPSLMENFWGERIRIDRGVTFAIRSGRAGGEGFLAEIRRAMWAVNNSVPLVQIRTLGDVFQASLAQTSFTLVMLGIAGAMALLLGLVGIYGVIAYAVSQRTREIGIRVALGAPLGELRQMFLRHGLVLATAGVVFGLAAAAALTRVMASLLFGVSLLDPITYAAVSVGLVAAAALASYVPARRATMVDPVKALRPE